MIPIELHAEADEEIEAYRRRYWNEGSYVGERFDAALDRAVSAAQSSPESYPRHPAVAERQNIRFVTLGKFPLSVVYKVREANLVFLALAHHSRRQGYWTSRLRTQNEG